ncbi:MAG: D-glycero-beta-D-manno-heptose-1,7-bisphosphate 7-phosphatase [Nitrosospira sp. 56-18]|jgi:D-glycero-D-manno-heptose 1,7-bisphosphate phosphatase|nr:D-glycero-beta-D-manno-heptose 1,7-bisphosphate 7-phosphatase [Nitrosospira sp.]OJY15051.1 MAG: D-glycero-beta-D-manno-heptose-1,7-bisphosphate 7-phosphatase [Nitrosospira sp. 56-18]
MKLVILDRDGVINYDSEAFIKSPEEWKPIPGSLEAIARFTQAGYRIVVATNQSGIGRGLLDMVTLNAINDKMYKAAIQAGGRIDAMFFCPHTNSDQCDCRKPATGMFREISERFGLGLAGVPAIGDSLRDLQAAAGVGAIPVLVLTGKGKATQAMEPLPQNTMIFPDLAAAADILAK